MNHTSLFAQRKVSLYMEKGLFNITSETCIFTNPFKNQGAKLNVK